MTTMIHYRNILQSALRQSSIQTRSFWRPAVRSVSTAAQPNTSREPSRWMRRLIYTGIFGTLGVSAGKWLDNKIAAPPAPGSLEDQLEIQEIQRVFDIGLPIVQELRRNPDYVEKDVYENFSDKHKTHRLTSGPLAGSRGLGLQVGFSFSHLGPRHMSILHECRTFSLPNLGIPLCLTILVFGRKFSGMTKRRKSSAWSSWDQASKAGQPWSMGARSAL